MNETPNLQRKEYLREVELIKSLPEYKRFEAYLDLQEKWNPIIDPSWCKIKHKLPKIEDLPVEGTDLTYGEFCRVNRWDPHTGRPLVKTIAMMSLAECAAYLQFYGMHITREMLAAGIRQGVYPFGDCIDGEHLTFQIFTGLVDKWVNERLTYIPQMPLDGKEEQR